MAVFDERKFLKKEKRTNLLLQQSNNDKKISNEKKSLELKRWLILLHLSPLLGFMIGSFFIGPLAFFIFPIIIGLYKNQSLIIVKNCIDLINYILSWIIYSIAITISLTAIAFTFDFKVLLGFTLFFPLLGAFLCLNGALNTFLNKQFHYPLKISIIRINLAKKK